MVSNSSKINLNRLTLPQRRYLLRLHEAGGSFHHDKELSWMTGTREQLLKRHMVKWIQEEGRDVLRITTRGQDALQSSKRL